MKFLFSISFFIRTIVILVTFLSFTKVNAQDIPDESAVKEMIGYAYDKTVSDQLTGYYAYHFANNSVNFIETLAERKLSDSEKKEVRAFYFNLIFELFSHEKQVDFVYRTEGEYLNENELKDALKLAKTPEGQRLITLMNRLNFSGVNARMSMLETERIDFDFDQKKFSKALPNIKLKKQ